MEEEGEKPTSPPESSKCLHSDKLSATCQTSLLQDGCICTFSRSCQFHASGMDCRPFQSGSSATYKWERMAILSKTWTGFAVV